LGQTSNFFIYVKEKLGVFASSPVPSNVSMLFDLPFAVFGDYS